MSSSIEENAATAPEITFRGTDGSECEAFVVAIRRLAFAKGLEKDRHWMLHFATTCLRGKALRWHARLEPSIKDDWDLFVQALFDQYPSVEEPSDELATPVWSATTFTPSPSSVSLPQTQGDQPVGGGRDTSQTPVRESAAQHTNSISRNPSAVRQYDPTSTGLQIGLLRVVTCEGTTLPQYVWWGWSLGDELKRLNSRWCNSDWKRTTVDRQEALVVSFVPSPEPHEIGSPNSRPGLGVISLYPNDQNSIESYSLCGGASLSGYLGTVWNVLADGTLQASLSASSKKSNERIKFATTEVHLDTAGNIWFVRPENTLEEGETRKKPSKPVIQARVVFEPL